MIYERTEQARRSRRAGFTLVELLVVIAIISILAGMLIPALGRSLDCARQIRCIATLKQLGTACMLYADDNDDWMPAAQYGIYNQSPIKVMNTWVVQTMPYVASDREWDESKELPEVYTCSANMEARKAIEPLGKSTTYGYNRRMGIVDADGTMSSIPSYRLRKLSQAKFPSQFGVIADKSKDTSVSSEYPHLEFYNYTFACRYLATVHMDDTSMLYADGHAEKLVVLPDVNWRRLGIFSTTDYSSNDW